MSKIDQVLETAMRRLRRVTPEEAARERERGALLIDTRTSAQRQGDGEIPGALVVDRTVLEWRSTLPLRIGSSR